MIPLGDDGSRRRAFPFVVLALIAINIAVFAHQLSVPDQDAFINAFAAIPYDITNNVVLDPPSPPAPPLTILTAMFLHGSILHIAFNMLFLFVFGPEIESLFGHLRFAAFYLVCGVAGELAQIAVGPGSHVPAIGASGAIAGVLGAYIVHRPTASINTIVPIGCFPLFLRLPAILVIGVWAAVQFVHGFGALSSKVASEQGGTAYFAHIGGFAAGVIIVGLFARGHAGTRRGRF